MKNSYRSPKTRESEDPEKMRNQLKKNDLLFYQGQSSERGNLTNRMKSSTDQNRHKPILDRNLGEFN